jgi:hypothetical protein
MLVVMYLWIQPFAFLIAHPWLSGGTYYQELFERIWLSWWFSVPVLLAIGAQIVWLYRMKCPVCGGRFLNWKSLRPYQIASCAQCGTSMNQGVGEPTDGATNLSMPSPN